jgi:hypothetical protein
VLRQSSIGLLESRLEPVFFRLKAVLQPPKPSLTAH